MSDNFRGDRRRDHVVQAGDKLRRLDGDRVPIAERTALPSGRASQIPRREVSRRRRLQLLSTTPPDA